ncbi:NAD(P)/FAD-dependent oxidoreductase [Amycolatopsis taiwanensis]|uniref:NAD(P)/FAD-dependent oxidoreductase n=1 Tax=Amycolatopsis taiwanensis TaxID=342230 RepID=UPI0004874496|nr:FAD-dependent oxidoreductase [Amycolatopsis taiwanensis]
MHIVVLGGGYSGLLATKLLAKRTNAKVTLINAADRFVERVRLHQLSSGQQLRDLPFTELLDGSGVDLIIDRATAIDVENRAIRLENAPEPVSYDVLFYAVGSQANLDMVPGAAEHAYTVADAAGARRLHERVTVLSGGATPRPRLGASPQTSLAGTVAVVGGGLTGIEAASELAESNPELKVRLVTGGEFGGALSDRGRRHLRSSFERLGIEISEQVRVTEVRADGLMLAGGEHIPADIVIWTTGFRVPALAREAGFAVDADGRMIVDETLRSVSHPEVYAVGDAAAAHRADNQELRMACATGLPTAAHAVGALADRLAGRTPKPLDFGYRFRCISLGRRNGLIQFVRADDSPVERVLTGRMAALYKEAIVRSTIMVQRHPALAKFA